MKITSTLLWLLLLSTPLLAQDAVLELQQKYPDEDAIYLNLKEQININRVGGELTVSKDVEERLQYLTDKDIRYSRESIWFSSFSEIKDFDAATLLPSKKGKYKSIQVDDYEIKDVITGGIFYDDYQKIEFNFPSIEQGAITQLKYEEVIKDPRMLGVFYFNSYVPVESAELSISCPKDVKLAYKLFGENTSGISFEEKLEGGRRIYTWKASAMPKWQREADAPGRNYYDPHVIVRISEMDKDGAPETVLSSVEDLYKWYVELAKGAEIDENEELKALAEGLVKGLKTNREKAKAIYQWVQQNISYVAFEDGMGGFVPRPADKVCSRKFGDCKDMANLTKELLGYVGVDGYLTWIGTRSKPYSYEDVPAPVVDNHMIAAIKDNDEYLFMDATGNYIPFGAPTPFIQGKEALIGIDEDNFEVVKVPVVEKERNSRSDKVNVSIKDRELRGKGASKYTGYRKVSMERAYYGNDLPEDALMQSVLEKGTNNFELTDYELKGLKDNDLPLEVDYDFLIPGYVKPVRDKIYINLNLDKPQQAAMIEQDKKRYPKEISYRWQDEYEVSLNIPEGYKVDYLPPVVSYKGDLNGFDIQYEASEKTITLTKTVYTNTILVTKDQFDAWNKGIEKLLQAYKEAVVLVKNNP